MTGDCPAPSAAVALFVSSCLSLILLPRPTLTNRMHTHTPELLPILQGAFPAVTGFSTVGSVVQANAEGHLVKLETTVAVNDDQDHRHPENVFIKQVSADKYSEKSWPDFRRTLMYLRTEIRFYKDVLPKLQEHGFDAVPTIFSAEYHLDGLITEEEKATDQIYTCPNLPTAMEEHGGSLLMEAIGEPFYQDSPISISEAKLCLEAVAKLHAAAWEQTDLLQLCEDRLSRGSYHLKTRNPKELEGMEQAWESFRSNFQSMDPELFQRAGNLGKDIKELAEYISDEVSPGPNDPYATLSHGDFKSMNVFLPKQSLSATGNNDRGALLVDFASAGVGLGMSDVAMHISHAVTAANLANGGEQELFDYYLETLNSCLPESKKYPKDVALRHYRLAVADYFRFFLGRFWKSATPSSFDKKKDSKNTALINRDAAAALAFLNRVIGHVREIQKERAAPASQLLHSKA